LHSTKISINILSMATTSLTLLCVYNATLIRVYIDFSDAGNVSVDVNRTYKLTCTEQVKIINKLIFSSSIYAKHICRKYLYYWCMPYKETGDMDLAYIDIAYRRHAWQLSSPNFRVIFCHSLYLIWLVPQLPNLKPNSTAYILALW